MSDNISSNYNENDIEVLEGLEPVRKRPGMYIGSTGVKGLHHLVYEIVDNSIDESLAGRCSEISVTINEDGSITVKDNGAGIPCGIHPKMKRPTLEVILTVLHAGGKFGGNGYKKSGGLHGVGSSVVNALSSYMKATVCREGKIYQQEYSKGIPTTDVTIIGETNEHGTTITFLPDKEIFETINFNYNTLANKFRESAFLNKQITIHFEDKREKQQQSNTYHFDGGIKEFVNYLNKDKNILLDEVIYISKKDEVKDVEVEIGFRYIDDYGKLVLSYANNINTTEGGTHVKGFENGLLKALNTLRAKEDISKRDFILKDIQEGLTAVISVKLTDPQFEGQTKTKLGNSYVKESVEKITQEYLESYFLENLEETKKILNKALQSQRFRESMEKSKELAKRKRELNDTRLVGKLADCISTTPSECEIHIVEGDSAGGSAKQARDRNFQAILPSKGKIINCEKQTLEKVLGSDEIKMFITAIGTGIEDDFDINKRNYERIHLMQDADSDGGHIRVLWITFIWRYMRELIEQGHVFIDVPPLYKNAIGKEDFYTYTENEQKQFLGKYPSNTKIDIQRFKGLGEMSPEQLWSTTLDPEKRVLIQVTIDDAIACEDMVRLLMGSEVTPRKQYLKEFLQKEGRKLLTKTYKKL